MRFRFILLALAALLGACHDEKGPVPVQYGREVCTMCGMIISDPHYAAEIRGGPKNQIVKFDDIGDAIQWLDKKSHWSPEDPREFWVMNSQDGVHWLDARAAFYIPGESPMDYGWAAVPERAEGAADFAAMRAKVLERGVTSQCTPGGAHP